MHGTGVAKNTLLWESFDDFQTSLRSPPLKSLLCTWTWREPLSRGPVDLSKFIKGVLHTLDASDTQIYPGMPCSLMPLPM